MFDIDRQLRGRHHLIATEQQECTAAQKQQDIFETHRHRVFSLSYYMTENEQEAEQVLTATFLRAFASEALPDAECVDQALLTELERRFSFAPVLAATPDWGVNLEQGQVRRTDLEEAMAALPSRERLVFLLRDVEGYSPQRIATLLRCDLADVGRTLLSARIRMRNALLALKRRISQDALELLERGA